MVGDQASRLPEDQETWSCGSSPPSRGEDHIAAGLQLVVLLCMLRTFEF